MKVYVISHFENVPLWIDPHHSCFTTTPLVTSEISDHFQSCYALMHNIFYHCAARTSAISSLSAPVILIVYGRQQSDLLWSAAQLVWQTCIFCLWTRHLEQSTY